MKRQPTEWVKIFANNAADMGLIPKICKQFIQLNKKKQLNWKIDCFFFLIYKWEPVNLVLFEEVH